MQMVIILTQNLYEFSIGMEMDLKVLYPCLITFETNFGQPAYDCL